LAAPIRVDRPAASTMAVMFELPVKVAPQLEKNTR
jgi:hypothetical protein